MRQVLHIILLTAMIWILCGTSTVWCQLRQSPKHLERVLRMMLEDRNAYSHGEISEEEYNQRIADIGRRTQIVKGDEGDARPLQNPTSSKPKIVNLSKEEMLQLSPQDHLLKILRDKQIIDDIRYDDHLDAHGDYSKLKLIVRSRKPDYNQGEIVWITFFFRNDSDSEIHFACLPSVWCCRHLWKLFHSNYDEVLKMPKFEERIQASKREGMYGFEWGEIGDGRPRYFKLQPGQEVELHWMRLNDLFDLSKPDTYELTCFVTTVILGQKYQPPLQSNTLTFRILETSGSGATDTNDSPNVTYSNPPPGEEVFKQPKPPKNVFYDQGKIIDVSPYVFHREWREEMAKEAQAAPPSDVAKPPAE